MKNSRKSRVHKIIFLVVLCWVAFGIVSSAQDHPDFFALLSEMKSVHNDREKLSTLFRIGDGRVGDLLAALDNPNPKVSIYAQVIIRYLGNNVGTKGLAEWYKKQKQFPVEGPIPLPIIDQDLKFIQRNYVDKPLADWREPEKYIYALALDDSPKAKAALAGMLRIAGSLKGSYSGDYALKQVQMSNPAIVLKEDRDMTSLIRKNLFFVTPKERPYARVSVIGINGVGDKALVEIYVNRGILAEQWFHVVVRKQGSNWRYYSITPVAVS